MAMPEADRHLRVAIDWEVDALDPPASFGGWNTGRVAHQIFESLVEDDLSLQGRAPTQLVPALAERIDVSADGLLYTFHLRQGVQFHDGTAFDAAAVVYNLRRVWDKAFAGYSPIAASYNQVAMQSVASVDAIESHAVRVTLREPFPEFLRYMTQEDSPGSLVFLSPAALAVHGHGNAADQAAGTGPFMIDQRIKTTAGSGIRVRRNPDYWGGAPWLETITFIPMPAAEDRAAALIEGRVDLAYGAAPEKLDALHDAGLVVHEGDVPYVWYIAFNMRDGATTSLAVRQAVAHAVNKSALASLFGSATRATAGILPPASPSYDPAFPEPYPHDPARARQLLASEGLSGGFDMEIIAARAGSGQLDPVMIYGRIAEDLAAVGIRVTTRFHDDWVLYCEEWQEGMPRGIGASEMSWGMSADVWLEQVLHSRYRSPVGFNTGHYSSKVLDDILDSARREQIEPRRIDLYRAANRLVAEQLPVLPLLTIRRGLVAHSKRVKNFRFASQNWHDLRNVTLDGQ